MSTWSFFIIEVSLMLSSSAAEQVFKRHTMRIELEGFHSCIDGHGDWTNSSHSLHEFSFIALRNINVPNVRGALASGIITTSKIHKTAITAVISLQLRTIDQVLL
ncbi:hypothetical protein TCAL_15951 [Tigriopus californicus]|uniref:Secreted protein n=1 Tax=Tigriopus californicus TaxID=6832 RepID=A0A553PHC5_TIGCA|nr:hypothetical protein TCAL_15951 [Tigriopus californicus]